MGMSSYQTTLENPIVQDKLCKKVLIVEDDEVSYILLKEILSSYDIYPTRAINGKDAVNLFQVDRYAYDLVLMDIRMPKLNGYEATRKIKEMNPNVPVLAVTAYTHAQGVIECFDAGCDEYIAKPFNIARLLSVISNYMAIEN